MKVLIPVPLCVIVLISMAFAMEGGPSVPVAKVGALESEFDLVVSLRTPDAAILNQTTSQPYSIRGRSFLRPNVKIGAVVLRGTSQMVKATVNGKKSGKIRVMAFDANYNTGYDGVIGVGAVPKDEVTVFGITADEMHKEHIFPLTKKHGIYTHQIVVGDTRVDIRFGFEESNSKVNAAAGALLTMNGWALPGSNLLDAEVIFGVERPMESLTLQKNILGRPLKAILSRVTSVRAAELGQNYEETGDPNEEDIITVTGKSKKKSKVRPYIQLGRDWLEGCSLAVVRKSEKTLSVFCDDSEEYT